MDLKTLLGDAYRENMTLDEINAALADKNFVDPATLPKSVAKDVFDKTASELAKVKKELKDLQESTMTADEKLKAELEKATTAQLTYKKELSKLRAKEIFVSAGLTEADYSSILDAVVSEDEETTKARAKSMVDLISAQKAAVEKAVKAELLKGTPKPPAGEGGDTDEAFEKEIEAARANGDMATVAALIRQRAMSENK
jgi:DNA-binding transcriptional MerR regulator